MAKVAKNKTAISNTAVTNAPPTTAGAAKYYPISISTTSPSAVPAGSVFVNTGTGGLTWANSTTMYPGQFSINSNNTAVWSTTTPAFLQTYDLLGVETFELNINSCNKFLAGSAVSVPTSLSVDYPLYGKTYSVFIEQDYTDISLNTLTAAPVVKKNRRLSILALDKSLYRLEFCSVFSEADPKANLEHLVDDTFSVVSDKTAYISTLYCRFMPILLYNIQSVSFKTAGTIESASASFERCVSSGITPIMHLSNVVFGGLLPPHKSEIAGIFDNLTTEVLVLNKQSFPNIQPYFSPEYGYLTLDTSKDIKAVIRSWADYTESGVFDLLTSITLPGTKVQPFVTCLLEHIGLDQQVKDTADCAVSEIKRILDSF